MAAGGITCRGCGVAAPELARFCPSCGKPLGSSEAPVARKTVTAVFCDVTGSTELVERLDAEVVRATMERYFSRVSDVISRHGGTVEKYVGDAVMAVFGVPVVHEDDALRACRTALEILAMIGQPDDEETADDAVRLGVRIGVETGEAVVGDVSRGSTFASGAVVNTAARLEQAARRGECIIGPGCFRLVRDWVIVEQRAALSLKGIAEPIDAYALLDVDEQSGERTSTAGLVGRSQELAWLGEAFERAVTGATCQLVTVLAPAGMGKTRLAAEFMARVQAEATVLHGRCLSYGEGVTYWPLVEAVRQAADVSGTEPEVEARAAVSRLLGATPDTEEVVARIASVAGLGGVSGPPEDTVWATQRLLELLARNRPVVLVVDDLHWAEPGLVDLLEVVCDSSRGFPILVAVFARSEFMEDHASWSAARDNAFTLLLEPLAAHDVEVLTGRLLGGVLPPEAAEGVRNVAGGNPLFVEQLLATLLEVGLLRRVGSDWVFEGDATSIKVPPTISALLTARLDRLPSTERAVLGAAAVIGQIFYPATICALTGQSPDRVRPELRKLARKGLVRSTDSDLPEQEAMGFGHILVRDAAYGALSKSVRSDLHVRCAQWLKEQHQGPAVDDFISSHLEASYHLRAELGMSDEATRLLGREATERLCTAARLLLLADDYAALTLLERAQRLGADEGPDRWEWEIELARAMFRNSERLFEAVDIAQRVDDAAKMAGDDRWATIAGLVAAHIRQAIVPEGTTDVLRRLGLAALTIFTAESDHYGIALAHLALADVDNMAARTTDQLMHLRLAAEHAEMAGRHREAQLYRQLVLTRLIHGDCQAEHGLAESRQQFGQADTRAGQAFTAACVSHFAVLMGDRRQASKARETAEQLVADQRGARATNITWILSLAEVYAGNWREAAALCNEVCVRREASGDLALLSTDMLMHTHALLHCGRPHDARAQLERAREISADEDMWNAGLMLSAEAWLAALDNRVQESLRAADSAPSLAPEDLLPVRALIHEACANAAAVVGDHTSARSHFKRALALHRAKGNFASTTRLQEALRG